MIKVTRKHLEQPRVYELLTTLDPSFTKRLERLVDIEDYSRKLSNHACFEIAENEDGLIGAIAFYENEQSLFIPFVCVSIHSRRMGVADSLLKSICQYADTVGKPISLEVRSSNSNAINLYTKHSFNVVNKINNKLLMTRDI